MLMLAVWRLKSYGEVIVHSDQGSQYGCDERQRLCPYNAVAESFFSSLKEERIRKLYPESGNVPAPQLSRRRLSGDI
jgi:hypothetical protein